MVFFRPKPQYNFGDLLVYNPTGEFGNENDRLFHVWSRRYGRCTGIPEKQWWYSGELLELKDSKSEGLPQVPIFATGLSNTNERSLKRLEELVSNQ